MRKPRIANPADELLAWMRENKVVSATQGGISLTLHPSAFSSPKPVEPVEVEQPTGQEVELPEDLQDMDPTKLMFFSSHAGPPPGEPKAKK